MNDIQQRTFEIICTTTQLFITSYDKDRWQPNWLFHLWHKRARQVAMIDKAIQMLKESANPNDKLKHVLNELIQILVDNYYYLFTHTESKRLREKVQDAILMSLTFTENDIAIYEEFNQKKNLADYLQHFQKKQELQNYRNYFADKHAIYGVPAYQLSETELTQIAKAGLINGKLVERFGVIKITAGSLHIVKKELQELIDKKIEAGFLTLESAKSYSHKIDLLLAECADPQVDETSLLQNSRYVLENIINAAGILPLGPAKYREHAVLITACYWVDEFLQQAQAEVEFE